MRVDVVVKVGGGVLADRAHFDATLAAIEAAAAVRRLVVVPGGGPFADAVRAVDQRIGLSDAAAHWVAILGMDQHACVIADRLRSAVVVADPPEIEAAFDAGRTPVLAPYRWLRAADPLPHSWDVTSDSISAWVARALGAPHLLLVKPAGARGSELLDAWFPRVLAPSVAAVIVAADERDAMAAALAGRTLPGR